MGQVWAKLGTGVVQYWQCLGKYHDTKRGDTSITEVMLFHVPEYHEVSSNDDNVQLESVYCRQ